MILGGGTAVTAAQNSDEDESENIHSAVSSEKCYEMEDKYGWQLKDKGWGLGGDSHRDFYQSRLRYADRSRSKRLRSPRRELD